MLQQFECDICCFPVGVGGHIPEDISEVALCADCHPKWLQGECVYISRILVVSHEPLIIDCLKKVLDWPRYGYQIEIETSGAGAIRKAKTFQPQILIIDPIMPGLGAVNITQQISRERVCGVLFLGTHQSDSAFIKKNLESLHTNDIECAAHTIPFQIADFLRELRLLSGKISKRTVKR